MTTLLDGKEVKKINSDLTAGGQGFADITTAKPLVENEGWSFFGICLAGDFDIPGELARTWLALPNPHGRPNSDVLKPIYNGQTVMKRFKRRWVIDYGPTMGEADACQYEAPFEYVVANVKPKRIENRERIRREKWWRLGRPRPELRHALQGLSRYIATVETTKHRVFSWFPATVAPEHNLIVIPRSDDETIGILSSRHHVVWSLAAGGRLGVGNDPRYNSTRCFRTFAFPDGLTLNLRSDDYTNPHADDIAVAAQTLTNLRDNWLNPPEWVERMPEVADGYPERVVPKEGHEDDLKKRTLTNLYNEKPTWLINAHKNLDEAVAAAYGWSPDLTDDEILANLLELNLSRTSS